MSRRKMFAVYQKTLKETRAKNIRYRTTGKHPVLMFEVAGIKRRVTLPSTPSDHRSIKNAVAQIRRSAKGGAA